MISAVVLTKNEEANIKDCLRGLQWCDEILVIDDGSTDKTEKIAKTFGARVIKHEMKGDFAYQRNFALRQTQGDWVLFVDADERVSKELSGEIKESVKKDQASGFYFRRIDFFWGKWLKHGEIGGVGGGRGYGGIRILRLAKKGSGNWIRKVDEFWEVREKNKTLKNPLLHFPHPTLTSFLASIDERSTLNAEQFYQTGAKVNFLEWGKPLAKFIQNYFLRLGFLDGVPGFVFAVLMSLHSFLVRGKLYLMLQKDKGEQKYKKDKITELVFIVWAIFVFISYLFFLYQRGKVRW